MKNQNQTGLKYFKPKINLNHNVCKNLLFTIVSVQTFVNYGELLYFLVNIYS